MQHQYATIVRRLQHAKVGRRGWPGPDKYLAIAIHDGTLGERTPLNRSLFARRGWEIVRVGEYYSRYTGPRSRFARVWARAEEIVKERGLTLVPLRPRPSDECAVRSEQSSEVSSAQ